MPFGGGKVPLFTPVGISSSGADRYVILAATPMFSESYVLVVVLVILQTWPFNSKSKMTAGKRNCMHIGVCICYNDDFAADFDKIK